MGTITASAGGGNWSSTGTWTGGVVPTATDDVLLASTSGNVTIDTSAAVCNSLNCSTYTGTLTHTAGITLTIGSATAGLSSVALTLVSGMTYTVGSSTCLLNFVSTSATQQTITTGGKALGSWTINGAGSSYKLADTNTATGTITLTAGTLNTNAETCNWGSFVRSGTSTAALTLGASSITVSLAGTAWSIAAMTGLTLSAASSTIICSGVGGSFSGSTGSYGTLEFTGTGTNTITGAGTFVNLDDNSTGGPSNVLSLAANISVTGTFTVNGASAPDHVLVQSNTMGTQRTITVGSTAPILAHCDFQDIAPSGAGWSSATITGTIGDCQGNSGVLVQGGGIATASRTLYWFKDTGNASTFTNWYTATNGGGSQATAAPLPQDTLYLDANSFSAAGKTWTCDIPRLCANFDYSGVTNNPILANNAVSQNIYGNFSMAIDSSAVFGSNYVNLCGRGSQTITTNGGRINAGLLINAVVGTYTLVGNYTTALTTNADLKIQTGTFNANGYNLSMWAFSASGTNSLEMGSGTWTLTGTGTVWSIGTTTLTASTSTIVLTDTSSTAKTFVGNGRTYNNITITPGGSGAVIFTGSNGFNDFICAGGAKTLTFPASTTTTVSAFNVRGTPGNLVTIQSSSSGTAATLACANSVSCEFISLTDNTASGHIPFSAGINSTIGTNVTNWVLTPTPSPQTSGQGWLAVLNQLAGTSNLGELGALNTWAGTKNMGQLYCLNKIAGTTNMGLNACCNTIAGTTGLEALDALNIAAGNIE